MLLTLLPTEHRSLGGWQRLDRLSKTIGCLAALEHIAGPSRSTAMHNVGCALLFVIQ